MCPLVLLRAGLPDLVLRPGALLAARVAERHDTRGLLMLAQAALVAELPEGVAAGDVLRLAVHDVKDGKAFLRIVPDGQAAQGPQPPAPAAVPLPGGARVRVDEEERAAAAAEGRQVVALTYEAPSLGRMDLQLELHGGGVSVRVRSDSALAADGAGELEAAIAGATGRPARVTVAPRPFEAYA